LLSPPGKGGKNPPLLSWACAVTFAFTIFTYVTAVKLTTAANVILLQYSAPVWAALLGWRLAKEKPNWEHWGALVFVAGGLFLFFGGGLDSGAVMGNTLAIISGVLLGAHMVFLRMLKAGNPKDAMLLAHALIAALSIPFVFLYPPALNIPSGMTILYMGTVQMGVTSLLISYGIKHTTAIQAMLTSIIDPILNPVWVMLITGEKPSLPALAGGAIIIAAVVSSSIIGKRREERISDIPQ
jgi:drug/metabolite transporter (DMT)-like permease